MDTQGEEVVYSPKQTYHHPIMDVGKLYTTQISLTEWFEKREYLQILREEIGLAYDAGIKLDLNEKCALRLIPLVPNLPKLRIRGKTVAESMKWFGKQKIDPTKYRAEFIPHVGNAIWSTIFVINKRGIFGEIIKGNHFQLTQGFHESGKPIQFAFNFRTWKLSPANPAALKHLQEIMQMLYVPSGMKQRAIKKRLSQAVFAKNYLRGYFETLTSKEHGLWFADYNTILGEAISPPSPSYGKRGTKGAIQGTPTSAGIVRGTVGKEILVVPMTTPEHVPLIMKSKGIITELGGILSHAAIVCRELKKPCITGVAGATKKLKPGMMIEMNGSTGEIKIL